MANYLKLMVVGESDWDEFRQAVEAIIKLGYVAIVSENGTVCFEIISKHEVS